MCNIFDVPQMWAEKQKKSEADAFEKAIKRLKPEDIINKLTEENASLRQQLKEQSIQIQRLRECICRTQEDFYD